MKLTLSLGILFASSLFGQCANNCETMGDPSCSGCHVAQGYQFSGDSRACGYNGCPLECASCAICQINAQKPMKLDVVSLIGSLVPKVKSLTLPKTELTYTAHAQLMKAALKKGVLPVSFHLGTIERLPLEIISDKRKSLYELR